MAHFWGGVYCGWQKDDRSFELLSIATSKEDNNESTVTELHISHANKGAFTPDEPFHSF